MASPGIGDHDPVGRYPVFMLGSVPVAILAGTILGYLAGLGIGGGSLLVLWLTLVVQLSQSTARAINLLFFIPTACTVCLFRWKQGALDIPKILPAIIAGCCAAALLSWISTQLDVEKLKKLFALLLLITGIREIFYRPRKAK